jgi:predicted RecB family nuclease
MKTKLLKKLRDKHMIVSTHIRVLTKIYSVKPLHKFPNGRDEVDMVEWCTYSYSEALKKQRELILKSLKKYR